MQSSPHLRRVVVTTTISSEDHRRVAYALILLMLMIGCIVSGVMALNSNLALPREMRGSGARRHRGSEGLRDTVHHDFHSARSYYEFRDEPRARRYERAAWEDPDPVYEPMPSTPRRPGWCIVLDIEKTAGQKEIRAAYARVMRGLHPDVVKQDAMTSQRCAAARTAYDEARQYAQANGNG